MPGRVGLSWISYFPCNSLLLVQLSRRFTVCMPYKVLYLGDSFLGHLIQSGDLMQLIFVRRRALCVKIFTFLTS